MARQRTKSPAPKPPKASKAAIPGIWQSHVQPLLEKRSLALAILLMAIAALRIAATYPVLSPTFDEPGHMACGLQFLARHVYAYESQHPPLARVMSALGPYLDGARPLGIANQNQEGVEVLYHYGHPDRTLVLMRLGILPFFLLAGLVVYVWARHYFGKTTAVFAAALFSMLPPVLAHAGLATTDMALAACLSAAFLALILWAESPTVQRSLLLGVATALAVLSKFTTLAFLPAAGAAALVCHWASERPTLPKLAALARERAAMFGLAALTGAFVIWAGYLFSFGKVPGWGVSLPAPELFDGIHMALVHNVQGHPAYLLGQVSRTGWWYYFPVVLAVKTPMAFLLLLAFGCRLCWKNRGSAAYLLPIAFSLGILVPSMAGHVNIGVRHILPVYAGFSIVAALGLTRLAEWSQDRKWSGAAMAAPLLWMALSGAAHHPDYISYFNEFVPSEPERVLVDSDLEWGQDIKRLARRLHELHAPEVSFFTMNFVGDRLQVWPGLPPMKPIDPLTPAEGWTAVSPTFWKTTQYGLEYRYPNLEPWFAYLKPAERVGSLLLYYVPPGSLKK